MYRLIYVVERLDGSEHRVPSEETVNTLLLAELARSAMMNEPKAKTANVIRIDIEEVA